MENSKLSIVKKMKNPLALQIDKAVENIPDFPIAGVQFKDISPLFLNPELYKEVVKAFADFSRGKVDVVCGLESRGYLFGVSIAAELNVPFVLVRKKGKLPPPIIGQSYALEYGTAEIEMRQGQIQPGQRVLIHDDLLATGGTAAAATALIEKQGGTVAQYSFLIELYELEGRKQLKTDDTEVLSLTAY